MVMSRIEKLIKEKCPNGVEYKTLGELGEFMGGLTGKSKDDFSDGNAVLITYKNVYSNPALDIEPLDRVKIVEGENQRTLEYGDVIFTGSSEKPDECGISSVVTKHPIEKLYLNSFCFVFRLNDLSIIEPNFAKHLFRSHDLRYQISKTAAGVTRYNISKDKMKKVMIPLPPIEIQQEIVRILDKFTELEAGLQAELDVRKKQYEYYRKWLTSFDNEANTTEMTLGDIYDFQYGKGNNVPTEGGEYPVYGSNGIAGWHHEYNSEDAPVIGHIGAYAGIVNWASGKHFVTYNGVICKHKNSDVNKRYAYYLLMIQDFLSEQKGAQPFVSYDALKKPVVKIPPLKEQERLVRILDIFNMICSNYVNGLPAEIEARHKQYEYYRDKLLTFERKVM